MIGSKVLNSLVNAGVGTRCGIVAGGAHGVAEYELVWVVKTCEQGLFDLRSVQKDGQGVHPYHRRRVVLKHFEGLVGHSRIGEVNEGGGAKDWTFALEIALPGLDIQRLMDKVTVELFAEGFVLRGRGEAEGRVSGEVGLEVAEFLLPQAHPDAERKQTDKLVFEFVLKDVYSIALYRDAAAVGEDVRSGNVALRVVEGVVVAGVQHDYTRVAGYCGNLFLVDVLVSVAQRICGSEHADCRV